MKSAAPIRLSDDEQTKVDTWVRRKSFPLRLIQRALIVRIAANGIQNQTIAQESSESTIRRIWKQHNLKPHLILFFHHFLPETFETAPRTNRHSQRFTPGYLPSQSTTRISPKKINPGARF